MLDALFKPKSVAVIGASAKEFHIGNRIIKNLQDFGFKGPIYPINPKADEIRGVRAYGSIVDVPTNVDVVHIVIPAKFVPQAIEDCGKKEVKFVILNGGGFAEVGPEGSAIQDLCMDAAKKNGIRILGPNCQGVINTDPDVRAYCNFTFTKPDPGVISIVALSGGVAEMIHQAFSERGIGTRMYASNGNACDITIPDIIRYYGDDEGTRVIVLYVEGLRDPKTFLKVAKDVAAKKPILAMKAGRTEEGAKAAASHTGGLAKVDLATDLIFEKTGILSFRDEGELCEAAIAFATQPIPQGKRVGMITNTGGPAVIATDVLIHAGLEIPPLSDRAKVILQEKLFPEATISNPIDVLATASGEHFRAALDVMMEEEQIDSIYINFVTPFFVDTDSIAKEIAEVASTGKKPMVCNLMTDKSQWRETLRILTTGGVPCYSFPGTAARTLASLVQYYDFHYREVGQAITFKDIDRTPAQDILQAARRNEQEILSAAESYRLLSAYGLPVADWRSVRTVDEAQKAATDIGFPVVVKADSESVIHKSDMGGVALNLNDTSAVRDTIVEMTKSFEARDLQFFVQRFLPGGKEIILGAKAEEGLGHLIMFGVGGIYVEILKDVTFKLAPVTSIEAREMLSSIKTAPLLKGVRGEPAVDQEGLVEIIQRLSQLVTENPTIQELDLNPVLAFEDRVVIVDARVSLAE
jgi:acetyltransferase